MFSCPVNTFAQSDKGFSANTQRRVNVVTTSLTALQRRCNHIVCLLGFWYSLTEYMHMIEPGKHTVSFGRHRKAMTSRRRRNSAIATLCLVGMHVYWAAPCENVSSDICGQRKPRTACTAAQSDRTFTIR